MAGLEVIRTLNDHKIRTEAPVEVAVWTNEEGSRFTPVMMGSGVFVGAFPLESTLQRADLEGVTVGQALKQIGYAGAEKIGGRPVGAYFEAHIEQGPILEDTRNVIGVVIGALGLRWYDVIVTGQDAHAGPDADAPEKGCSGRGVEDGRRDQRARLPLPAGRSRHGGIHAGQAQFAQRHSG